MASRQSVLDSEWSRRQFLKRSGVGGAALLSAGSLAAFLEACAGSTSTSGQASNVHATWTNVVIADTLDPHVAFDTNSVQYTQNVYEGLLEYVPGGLDVRPLLAESYQASQDGMTYTFKIRQGVVFHDGSKLDANAVLASFQRLQGINQGPASYLINVKDFAAPDASTFVINMSAPYAGLPGCLPWFLIASPQAVASNKTSSDPWAGTWYASHGAGTGPYMLQNYQPNLKIDVTQNPHYWRPFKAGVPTSASMTQQADTTTQLELLQSGQSDFLINIGPDAAASAAQLSNVALINQPAIQMRTIVLNTIKPPLNDVRVRQALVAAFDYDAYNQFYHGYGTAANGPVPPKFPGWNSSLPFPKQDLNQAKSLLQQAGLQPGANLGRMLCVQGLNYMTIGGTILQGALKKIGYNMAVESPPWPQIPAEMHSPATSAQMSFLNVFPNTPDPALILNVAYNSAFIPSKGGYNFAYYQDSNFDSQLKQVVSIQDQDQRNQLLATMQQEIVNNAPTIFLIAFNLIVPVRKEWAHVKYDPFFQDGIVRWFYWAKGG
jgi:peptide/nickel transport system substrate-binding protein